MILFRIWRRDFFSKIYLYTFILSILISILLLPNITADLFRTQSLWTIGSEITFYVPKENVTEIEEYLTQNQDVISFTKIILVANELFTTYTGTENYYFGINSTEYIDFYSSWNKRGWITGDNVENFNNNSLYASKKLKDYDIEMGDTLTLSTGWSLTVKGFINKWPGFIPPISTSLGEISSIVECIVIDLGVLTQALDFEGIEYGYIYKLHASSEETENVATELSTKEVVDELSYINIKFHEGAKTVILSIILLVFQIFLLLWFSLFIYSNFEDINSSNKARGLGLLAVAKNYRKTFRKYKFLEFLMLIFMFIILTSFLFMIIYLLYYFLFGLKIIISFQTICNLLIVLGIYPCFLILQGITEILKYNQLNLSLLYRHPE